MPTETMLMACRLRVKLNPTQTGIWARFLSYRCAAARTLGLEEVDAELRQGDRRAAVLHAVKANVNHGLALNAAGKRRVVAALLRDEERGQWGDREIARRCKVSHTFVASIRSSPATVASETRVFRTKHGTPATMDISGLCERVRSEGGEPLEVLHKVGEEQNVAHTRAVMDRAFEARHAEEKARVDEIRHSYRTIPVGPAVPA